MPLLELPSEILIIIFESISDVRTLYDLAQTCVRARDVFLQNTAAVLDRVLYNAYSTSSAHLQGAISASRSVGDLDYAYEAEHHVEWIVPEASKAPTQSDLHADYSMNLLQSLADLVDDVENLAEWCVPKCQQKTAWYRPPDVAMRDSVVEVLCQLQLVSNRLYNVRLPAFPEHISLRTCEKNTMKTYISRKSGDQAVDLMQDQLRDLTVPQLKNMWILLQILQDEYLLLRRHRLRPVCGRLLDLLFQHNYSEKVWSVSPWFTIQAMLSKSGVHVVPARPGTAFRFLGSEGNDELQQRDVVEFDEYLRAASQSMLSSDPACLICSTSRNSYDCCPHDYLERFRGLIGLPYKTHSPIKSLVKFRGSMQPIIVANSYGGYESTTRTNQSALGKMLWECAESNRTIMAAKRRNSSRPL